MSFDPDQRVFGFNCWQEAPHRMSSAHQHDDVEFNLSKVTHTYLVDGEVMSIPPGKVGLFWAARPHQFVGDIPDEDIFLLTVPLGQVLSWHLPTAFMRQLFEGRLIVSNVDRETTEGARRFETWTADFASNAGYLRTTAAMEIEAYLRRISADAAASEVSNSRTPDTKDALSKAGLMANFISEHSSEAIGVEEIAGSAHLAPRYAMSLFKSMLGTTIGSYLAQSRVAQAQRMLLTTSLPVAAIGLAAGFQSQSQFYERFTKIRGMTPAAYRRLLRSHQDLTSPAASEDSESPLDDRPQGS